MGKIFWVDLFVLIGRISRLGLSSVQRIYALDG